MRNTIALIIPAGKQTHIGVRESQPSNLAAQPGGAAEVNGKHSGSEYGL